MQVGDIVFYKNDWKPKRPWYLYSLSKGDLCTIVDIRNGSIYNEKNGEKRLNSSIVNLNIKELEEL